MLTLQGNGWVGMKPPWCTEHAILINRAKTPQMFSLSLSLFFIIKGYRQDWSLSCVVPARMMGIVGASQQAMLMSSEDRAAASWVDGQHV